MILMTEIMVVMMVAKRRIRMRMRMRMVSMAILDNVCACVPGFSVVRVSCRSH